MKAKTYSLIFLVDDDELYLKFLSKKLGQNENFDIRTFSDGELCLQALDLKPDIIFLDYNLNSINEIAEDGIEILKKIKQVDPNFNVVMLSARDNARIALESVKYGALDYIVKNESTTFIRAQHIANYVTRNVRVHKLSKKFKNDIVYISIGVAILALLAVIIFGN